MLVSCFCQCLFVFICFYIIKIKEGGGKVQGWEIKDQRGLGQEREGMMELRVKLKGQPRSGTGQVVSKRKGCPEGIRHNPRIQGYLLKLAGVASFIQMHLMMYLLHSGNVFRALNTFFCTCIRAPLLFICLILNKY